MSSSLAVAVPPSMMVMTVVAAAAVVTVDDGTAVDFGDGASLQSYSVDDGACSTVAEAEAVKRTSSFAA